MVHANPEWPFSSLRDRALRVHFGGHKLWAATGRRSTEAISKGKPRTMRKRGALRLERSLRDQIRRLPAKPPNKRTHLRKRVGFRASCL